MLMLANRQLVVVHKRLVEEEAQRAKVEVRASHSCGLERQKGKDITPWTARERGLCLCSMNAFLLTLTWPTHAHARARQVELRHVWASKRHLQAMNMVLIERAGANSGSVVFRDEKNSSVYIDVWQVCDSLRACGGAVR